jgi:hypothetical protein
MKSLPVLVVCLCIVAYGQTNPGGGAGTVTSVSGTTNQIDVVTGTTTPVISLDSVFLTAGGDLSGTFPSPTVTKINSTSLAGLATGILKNTTTTGVPSIAAATDLPTLGTSLITPQLYAVDTGAVNAYVVTLSPAMTALTTGVIGCFKTANANTTAAPTVNFNGLGAITIVKGGGGTSLANGDIGTTSPVCMQYDGSHFYLLNPQAFTGSGKQVLSNGPAFTGTSTFVGLTATGVIAAGNTVRLTADSAGITATTPGTTFLTLSTLTASTNYSFICELLYSQATAAVLDGFSVQAATNAATDWDAWGTMDTTNPASTTVTGSRGSALRVTSTTSTPVVSATPGAIATVYQARLAGNIQVGASVPTINVAAFTGNASDAVTIKAGSFCTVTP